MYVNGKPGKLSSISNTNRICSAKYIQCKFSVRYWLNLFAKKYTSMKTVTITMTKPRSQAQNEIQAQNHNKLARNQVNVNWYIALGRGNLHMQIHESVRSHTHARTIHKFDRMLQNCWALLKREKPKTTTIKTHIHKTTLWIQRKCIRTRPIVACSTNSTLWRYTHKLIWRKLGKKTSTGVAHLLSQCCLSQAHTSQPKSAAICLALLCFTWSG